MQFATKQVALYGTGGDFFEIFRHDDGSLSVVMADVCGNGPAAAMVAGTLRPVLRRLLREGHPPAAVLVALNDWLTRQVIPDRFVTAVAVRVDARGRRIEIASAGHLGPFLRRSSGQVESLTFAAGVPLGMLEAQTYYQVSRDLHADDAVVLVTDGITDALSTRSDPLGETGLLRLLAAAPHATAGICRALLRDDESPRDDATVVVLQLPAAVRLTASDAPALAV